MSQTTTAAGTRSVPATPVAPRPDIQALRTIAVGLVVLYHFWPGAIRGGYIGVDVFFVISGFLITGQLLGLLERRGAKGLGRFWLKRARRLLPASFLVLGVSIVGVRLWAPAQDQVLHFQAIIASALYVSNWHFAAEAVDYLGAENAPAVAQHYWSLSVEEQFYLLWPLLVLVGLAVGARRGWGRRGVTVLVAIVTAVSLVLSLVLTSTDQPYAFFGTPARMWEFGLGALVALWRPTATRARWTVPVAWVGLALVLGTGLLYTDAVAFPGWAALVPVAATAAVIAAGISPSTPVIGPVTAAAPVQWIGEQSYAIYLWHWPFVVLAPGFLGRPPNLLENASMVLLCCVLAWATKRWVEDPIRFGRTWNRLPWWGIVAAALAAMAAVVVACLLLISSVRADAADRQAAASGKLQDPAACLGANAMLAPECAGKEQKAVSADAIVPALGGVLDDTGGAYSCYAQDPRKGVKECSFGSEKPDAKRILLTGDSHAAMLVPALKQVAGQENWRITTSVGRGCTWGTDPQRDATSCGDYPQQVDDRARSGDFDAVLTTARGVPDAQTSVVEQAATVRAKVWRDAMADGVTVIALRDNPQVDDTVADCLASKDSFTDATCALSRDRALVTPDPMEAAHEKAPGSHLVDLTDAYCTRDECGSVIGGVVVHRDLHHVTASFARTLAPYLAKDVEKALASGR